MAVYAAAVALFIWAIVLRRQAGRLPRSLVVEYAPRPRARVLDDAVLAEQDRRAAAAGLLALAVQRKVRLLAETSTRGRAAIGVEVVHADALRTDDVALLESLFGPDHPRDAVRRFSRDRRAVGRRVRERLDAVVADLRKRQLIGADRATRTVLRYLASILLIITAFFTLLLLVGAAWRELAVAAIPAALCASALWIVPHGAARRFTAAGDDRRRHLDGIRQYLSLAEADRMRVLHSPSGADVTSTGRVGAAEAFVINERLLPYAVILGVEKEWLAELKLAYDELDATSLAALGDVAETMADLLQVTATLGDLAQLAFAVGDLVDAGGGAFEVVGGVFEAIGDLTP